MCLKKLLADHVHLRGGAGSLVMLVQPGYIVFDIPPDDLERSGERSIMVLTEVPEALKFQTALNSLNTGGYRFHPKRRTYCFNADKCVTEIDGPGAYVDKVITVLQKLGLENLQA